MFSHQYPTDNSGADAPPTQSVEGEPLLAEELEPHSTFALQNEINNRARKKRRMRFNHTMDHTILKFVKFHSAHIAPHGRNQDGYEKALDMFVSMSEIDASNVQLSWKTLYDLFNSIVTERPESARNNALRSGNVEIITQFEQDLNSTISGVDYFEEGKNKKIGRSKKASTAPFHRSADES